MESEGTDLLRNSTVLISAFVGACVLLLAYILKQLNPEQKSVDDKPKNDKLDQADKKEPTTAPKGKKKGAEGRWTGRSDKQTFSNPWLLTSLKGHSAQVLDMDLAANGKFLASCAEEDPNPDPGGDLGIDVGGSSSGNSDSNPESSPPSSATPSPRTKGLSRRQRKNRRREDHSPPEVKKKTKPKKQEILLSHNNLSNQYINLKNSIPETDWAKYMKTHVMSYDQRFVWGYPVNSPFHNGQVLVYKDVPAPSYLPLNTYRSPKFNVNNSQFDVNAQEFVPGMDYSESKPDWNANDDSGQGSGNSSDSGEVLDDSESSTSTDGETQLSYKRTQRYNTYKAGYAYDWRYFDFTKYSYNVADARACVRCQQIFFISRTGEYITQDRCCYHWGKLKRRKYSCCNGEGHTPGCSTGRLHVWNGIVVGANGPYDNFVYTRPRKTLPQDGNYGIYALDCEMCYTAMGLELAKVTVIGVDGRLVYDSYVKPDHEIVDYNTRFSGITAKDLNKKGAVKNLREVQNDLMGFISRDTILVGHGLENDLRALRIVHDTVVDTAFSFGSTDGTGRTLRHSLKNLCSYYLNLNIQCDPSGHNSFEDARACMDLILWRIHNDMQELEKLVHPNK